MTDCVAFLRGINVGRAKRIAMADLRRLVEGLGCGEARTVLNSGNVLFRASRPNVRRIAAEMEGAIDRRFGFSAGVVVVTADTLAAIVEENPLLHVAANPARLLVTFVASAAVLATARELAAAPWAPEAFALGGDAAYLWCPNGVIGSKLAQRFGRIAGDGATTRNWATVLKVHAALAERRG